MSRMRTVASCVTAIAAVLALAACGGSSSSDSRGATGNSAEACAPKHAGLKTLKQGSLEVAAYVSPPYVVEHGDSYAGIDAQIVKKIAELECLEVQIKSVPGPALAPTVESKRADVAIGGIYYSKDRASKFSLTTPMYHDGVGLLSNSGVTSLEQLSGSTLGVVQGYLWNTEFQKALGSDHVKLYQSSASMITDLKAGRIDAAALTGMEAVYRAQKGGSLKATSLAPTPKVIESTHPNNVVLLLGSRSGALADAFSADIKTLVTGGFIGRILKKNGADAAMAGPAS